MTWGKAKLGLLDGLPWEGIDTVFIVSTGRTGTKSLANFFNQFAGIVSKHEPIPDCLLLGNYFARNLLTFEEARDRLRRDRQVTLNRIADETTIDTYIESNNRLYSLIPVIRDVFPEPRFVHIVRDGRDVVRSMMSRSAFKPGDRYRLKASQLNADPYASRWENLSRFEKICWWWQKKDGLIRKALNYGEDNITLKFEDLFSSHRDEKEIRRLVDFAQPNSIDNALVVEKFSEYTKEKRNATSNYALPSWEKWDPELKQKFQEIAGKHLEESGY